jgi:hypothetical protein
MSYKVVFIATITGVTIIKFKAIIDFLKCKQFVSLLELKSWKVRL